MPEAEAPAPRPVSYVCLHCQMGTLQLRRVVFAQWFGGQFVTMPNFPGWVCDVCGEAEYDAVALEQINTLLGAELGLRRDANRRARRSARPPAPRARPSGPRRV
ncbi:MAG: YgiT-type zinc finger protein [Anaerolineales bacterium]|nr:YgiT-type zinc finger protein [Anaerolineales bacterium]